MSSSTIITIGLAGGRNAIHKESKKDTHHTQTIHPSSQYIYVAHRGWRTHAHDREFTNQSRVRKDDRVVSQKVINLLAG